VDAGFQFAPLGKVPARENDLQILFAVDIEFAQNAADVGFDGVDGDDHPFRYHSKDHYLGWELWWQPCSSAGESDHNCASEHFNYHSDI
jgi:hypothetical protein